MKDDKFKFFRSVKGKLKLTLLISLFFHAIILTFHVDSIVWNTPKKEKTEKRVRVVLNTSKKTSQIVTVENTGRKEKPKDTKYLSEKDNTVDRQVVAKNIGTFKKAGKGVRNGVKTPSPAVKQLLSQLSKHKKTTGKSVKKVKKAKKKISFSDLSVSKENTQQKQEAKPSLASLGIKNGSNANIGLSQNNDFVEDVPLGDMTALNTIEYKYYGFYHRIKQKLEQYWGDTLRKKAETLYKSGRRIPASTNKITSLTITIDNFGNIVDVKVKGSSGVTEFDDAAIESFNRAGPFPNPPSGMIKDGIAQIEWGFVVKS